MLYGYIVSRFDYINLLKSARFSVNFGFLSDKTEFWIKWIVLYSISSKHKQIYVYLMQTWSK